MSITPIVTPCPVNPVAPSHTWGAFTYCAAWTLSGRTIRAGPTFSTPASLASCPTFVASIVTDMPLTAS